MRLHLGSGNLSFPGWVNLDLREGYDLRRGLPQLQDDSVESIYSCHLLEHLTYAEGYRLLTEILRVLRPGGVVRVGVPDFTLFARAYLEHDEDFSHDYLTRYDPDPRSLFGLAAPEKLPFGYRDFGPAGALLAVMYGWHHQAVYDAFILGRLLVLAGFPQTTVKQCAFGQSYYHDHWDLDQRFSDHTVFLEAVKAPTMAQARTDSQVRTLVVPQLPTAANPRLTVIVATCNRPQQLRNLLADFAAQTLASEELQFIVSDDGSEIPAETIAGEVQLSRPVEIVRGPRAGPAVARNRGLHLARAPFVLFLNDDMRLAPDLAAVHWRRQTAFRRATALLGTFNFTPEILRQPLNRIATEVGILGTQRIRPGLSHGPLAFCTGNLSIPLAEIQAVGGFDPAFAEPAGEDIDLGYRLLGERGLAFTSTHSARAWHDHPHDFATWWQRWQLWGRALRQLAEKHQDPLFWPGGKANMDPRNAAAALARLRAQEPLALELIGWVKRLSAGDIPRQQVQIPGRRRTFRLPEESEQLLRVGLETSMYFIQRAFWEEPGSEKTWPPGWYNGPQNSNIPTAG